MALFVTEEIATSLTQPNPLPNCRLVLLPSFEKVLDAISRSGPARWVRDTLTGGSITDAIEEQKEQIRLEAEKALFDPSLSAGNKQCIRFLARLLDEPDDLSQDEWDEIERAMSEPLRFNSE